MEASSSVPDLVAAAQASAKQHEDQIAEILKLMDGPSRSDVQLNDLKAQATAIELLAVDIFTVFEARMQHHFKRGPFSRKLKAQLTGAGQPDLADRIYEYYLVINVLKHGTGASHRELVKNQSSYLADNENSAGDTAGSLIDVTKAGFFDGLSTAILEAYHFLER